MSAALRLPEEKREEEGEKWGVCANQLGKYGHSHSTICIANSASMKYNLGSFSCSLIFYLLDREHTQRGMNRQKFFSCMAVRSVGLLVGWLISWLVLIGFCFATQDGAQGFLLALYLAIYSGGAQRTYEIDAGD